MTITVQQIIRRSKSAIHGLHPPAELPRILVVQTLTYAIGSGFYTAGSAVFFIIYAGLSPSQLATGASVVGAVCLLAQVPIGIAVDRIGGRTAWLLGAIGQAVSFACYLFVSGFASFLVVATCTGLSAQMGNLGRGRFLGELLSAEARVTVSAYLRSLLNLGLGLATGASALLLSLQSRQAMAVVVIVNSMSFIVDAALLSARFIPDTSSVVADRGSSRRVRTAIRDRPFVAVSLLNGMLRTGEILLTLILPVWLLRMTDGPRVVIPVALLINMIMVVMFQVHVSRGCDNVRTAARRQYLSGLATSVGCALFLLDWYADGAVVWILIPAATVFVTLGELLVMAAAWGLSYGLSPAEHRGEYLAVFGLGFQLSNVIAPVVFTAALFTAPPSGWLILGGFFVMVSAISVRATSLHRGAAT